MERNNRDWVPINMNGCVLYLPFWRLGANTPKIFDYSGQGNHGTITGAVPATYPMLSGIELVTNGGMESGNPPTGWTAVNTPETFEQSNVQKHSGSYSAHIVDSTPSFGGFHQAITTVAGKRYKISFWCYQTSICLSFRFYAGDGSVKVDESLPTEIDQWVYKEFYVTQTISGSSTWIRAQNRSSSVAAEFYIDDVSVQEVTGYEGLGWGFDGVDDYIDCGDILGSDSSFIFRVWFLSSGSTTTHRIFSKSGSGSSFYCVTQAETLKVNFALQTEIDIYSLPSSNPIDLGKKYCLEVTWDKPNNQLIMYLNGSQAGDPTTTSGTRLINDSNFLIGKDPITANRFLKGIIYEFIGHLGKCSTLSDHKNYYELTRNRYGV